MVAFPHLGRCLCGDVEYRLIEVPADAIAIEQQPTGDEVIELVRAWKNWRADSDTGKASDVL